MRVLSASGGGYYVSMVMRGRDGLLALLARTGSGAAFHEEVMNTRASSDM